MSMFFKRLASFDDFSSIGMTPPKGRQGHSVPAPISLDKDPAGNQGSLNMSYRDNLGSVDETDDPLSHSIGRQRRKESPGRPLTPLDKMLSRHECISPLETLEEMAEADISSVESYLGQFQHKVLMGMGHFAGEGMLSVSYGHNRTPLSIPGDNLAGSFVSAFSQTVNLSLNVPFMHQMLDSSGVFPTASRAPNKALFTISARTSRILVANKFACEVFGYQQSELVDAKIQRLFSEPYQSKQRALVEQHINSDGDTVLLSGKVMDAVRSDGTEFPVSVWMKGVKTEDEPRVIVVVEPVARANAHFTLNPPTKEILACDENFATLFGYLEPHEVVGKRITDFVPSVVIPEIIGNEDETLQQLTGRSKANTVFPLTVTFTAKECPQANTEDDDRVQVVLRGTLIVYSMLSGMLSFLPSGKIHGSNEQFALMMFGYTKEEMANMDILKLFPELYSHMDYTGDSIQLRDMSLCDPLSSDTHQNGWKSTQTPCDELMSTQTSSLFHTVSENSFGTALEGISLPPDVDPEDKLVGIGHDRWHSGSHRDIGHSGVSTLEDQKPAEKQGQTCNNTQEGEMEEFAHSFVDSIMKDATAVFTESSLLIERVNMQYETPQKQAHRGALELEHERHLSSTPLQDEVEGGSGGERLSTTPLQDEQNTSLCSDEEETSSRHSQVVSTPFAMKDLKTSLPLMDQHQHHQHQEHQHQEHQQHQEPSILFDSLPEGFYSGSARHKDGSLIPVWFQLRKISLADGSEVFCMWVSKDYDHELSQATSDQLAQSRNTPKDFRYDQIVSPDLESVVGTVPTRPTNGGQGYHGDPGEGEYDKAYENGKKIGEGAFGFVLFATQRDTGNPVVVKFLRKVSILPDAWLKDKEMGLVPLEIALLAKISHPHIVELIEAYENQNYFQMVMAKHGDGMDLFTFIDRCQMLTEALSSYMFRQVVSALDYLHERNIVHRDVKDENIILDTSFHLKLIDFGSASSMEPGKLFTTFCGTLEYCSPEVLLGNKYAGPELEMWSLGVTLYTLVYGQNPFHDVEETIAGRIHPPFMISTGLMKLLLWLLNPNPKCRATLADLKVNQWTTQPVNIEDYPFDIVMNGLPNDQDRDILESVQQRTPYIRSASEGLLGL
jgi:PAS domain-containing serine/threonine kinase